MRFPYLSQFGPTVDFRTVSCFLTGWHVSANLPMREEEPLSLLVTLPNQQRINAPETTVRSSSGHEFAVETNKVNPRTMGKLHHHAMRLVSDRPKRENVSIEESIIFNTYKIDVSIRRNVYPVIKTRALKHTCRHNFG